MEELLNEIPPGWRASQRHIEYSADGISPQSYFRYLGTSAKSATVFFTDMDDWSMFGATDIFPVEWVAKRWPTAHAGMAEIDDFWYGVPAQV